MISLKWGLVGVLLRVFIVVAGYQSKQSLVGDQNEMPLQSASNDMVDSIALPSGVSFEHSSGSIELTVQVSGSMRIQLLEGLMTQGFTGWVTHPYSGAVANGFMSYQGTGAVVWKDVDGYDSVDERIELIGETLDEQEIGEDTSVWIGSGVRSTWEDVYLFKNSQDLKDLGYEVVSTRRRISSDVAYRRKNIQQSFAKIGNVRVLPPSGDITFMEAAQYDGVTRQNYEYGYVVVGNQEKLDYGGGICGASSAIYQGIVSNGSLETPGVRNHTRRYGYLYDAYIDGELVTTPGIDSAVFDGSLDLEMVNSATHPIVLVMNYDGTLGGVEEVFTIGKSSDKQEVVFVSSYPITYTGPSGIGTGEITMRGGCYTWMIGDEEVRRCYRKVSQ